MFTITDVTILRKPVAGAWRTVAPDVCASTPPQSSLTHHDLDFNERIRVHIRGWKTQGGDLQDTEHREPNVPQRTGTY